jgi:hypothetical protein
VRYKNVLKRFPVDRLPEELSGDFFNRAIEIKNKAIEEFLANNPEYEDVDYYISHIYENERRERVKSHVIEILEIPTVITLADNDCGYGSDSLLIFRDCIKFNCSDDGVVEDIEPQNAMEYLIKNLNELENAILKVRSLIDAEDN